MMNLAANRLRSGILAGLALSILLFLLLCTAGLSKLGAKSHQLVDLKLQSRTLDDQLVNLSQAKKEVEKYSYFKQVAKTVIPSDKDQAQAVLDIFQLANQAGIALQSISFPASSLGTTASPAAGGTSTSSGSKAVSQAKTVQGISGLYSLELGVSPQTGLDVPSNMRATYPKLLDFLDKIERNRRTAQVTQVNVQPLGNGNAPSDLINFSLTINIFIKP